MVGARNFGTDIGSAGNHTSIRVGLPLWRDEEASRGMNMERLCAGFVRGSVPDGRSAFCRVAQGNSCGPCAKEVPVNDKSKDEGPVVVEAREDELQEGVRGEFVAGGGAVGDDLKRRENSGTKDPNGSVVDESEEKMLQQQRPQPKKKICQRNAFTNITKDGEEKAGNLKNGSSYPYHRQRYCLSRTESLAMLKNMVKTQNRWLPGTDKATGLPMSKQRSPYAYEKRWKFMTWMIEMANIFNMSRDTVSIAMNYLDRYTCCREQSAVVVQIAASASLFVAAKVEENDRLQVKALENACVGAFKVEQFLAMEKDLLKVLQWKLRPLTPYDVVGPFLALLDWSHRQSSMEVDLNQLTREIDVLLDLSHFDHQTVRFPSVTKVVAGLVLALASPQYHFRAPVVNEEGKACRVYDLDRAMILKTCQEVGLTEECGCVSQCAARMLESYWEALRHNSESKHSSQKKSPTSQGRHSPTGVADLALFLEEESARVCATESLHIERSKPVATVKSDMKVAITTKEVAVADGPSQTETDKNNPSYNNMCFCAHHEAKSAEVKINETEEGNVN